MVLLFGTVWVRASLPRLRYDQLMDLGWKWLIELAFLCGRWCPAVVIVGREEDWDRLGRRARGGPVGAIARARLSCACACRSRDEILRRGLLMGRFSGFGVTFRQMFKPRVTTRYPKEKRPKPRALPRAPRAQPLRGRHGEVHRLRAVRGGLPGAVHLRARAPTTRPTPRSHRASGTASSTRSTTCAASTATCASRRARPRRSPRPSSSSSRSPNRADAIYTKDELLVDDDGRARSASRGSCGSADEDEDTSAWMRATSPSGSAAYEGRILVERAGLRVPPARAGSAPEADRGLMAEFVIFFIMAAIALGAAIGMVSRATPCTPPCCSSPC